MIQEEKNSLFNKWISICKPMKLDPYFTPHITINSRQVKDPKGRLKIIKFI
jgi:hypothetical protein